MAQPKSQLPLMLGLAAAGGVGYYLYSAGGSPKAAEKKLEADMAKASAKIKGELPGRGKEAQKTGEAWASEAGAKIDSATDKARAELAKAEGKMEAYGKDAKRDTMQKIDAFDKTVEKKASEAKSGISSWFGGK